MATLGSDGNNQQAWSGTVHFTWGTCPLIYHSPLSLLLLTSLTNGHHLLVLWSFEFASPVLGRMRQQPPHIQRPNMHKKEYKSVHLPSATEQHGCAPAKQSQPASRAVLRAVQRDCGPGAVSAVEDLHHSLENEISTGVLST